MLTLKGNSAAVMLYAKGGLRDLDAPSLESLQCAIAVMAGLADPMWVAPSDVLRIVADTHDQVSRLGLLNNPARALVDSLYQALMLSEMSGSGNVPAPGTAVLNALLSNLTCMRIGSEDGEKLIDWTSELPAGFEIDVLNIARATWGAI